jgi:hypothetical protein
VVTMENFELAVATMEASPYQLLYL